METVVATPYQPPIKFLSFARIVGFVLLIFTLNRLLPLGTPVLFLGASAAAGVWLAYLAAQRRVSHKQFYGIAFGALLVIEALSYIFTTLKASVIGHSLGEYSLSLHINLGLTVFFIGLLSTWAFWTTRAYATVEALLIVFAAIEFFAGHRDFNFQMPKVLGTIAWRFNTTELWTLVGIGSVLTIFLLTYCFGANGALLYQRAGRKGLIIERVSPLKKFLRLVVPVSVLLTLIAGISYGVQSFYSREAAVRLANGVGQKESEQVSPLSFESAIGASAQPAAIVRLDGDYKDNPFVPMLYLREAALSKFNGLEMVPSGTSFDRDIPNIPPESSYERTDVVANEYRTPLRHSVFLIGEHKLAFAVDTPITITPLKNPKPDRFKGAYKAYSMAPAFPLNSLSTHTVGDPNWSEAEKLLYGEKHTDKRYAELAEKIVGTEKNPIAQAQLLIAYLNKNSIYTLQPKHEVEKDQDQTAPYLFGDMRGYCVHFAHAMVYLLRSLNIPARVATGYLTDLSQAEDGHVLLRMSDRHAWPEVFVTDIGWIPFDIKPEHVESHAETPIDTKLLEELMGMLGPDEEILPKETLQDPALNPPEKAPLVSENRVLLGIAGLAAVLLLVRFWTLYSYALTQNPRRKVKRGYRALLARLSANGIVKLPLSTKREFQKLVEEKFHVTFLLLTDDVEQMLYSKDKSVTDTWLHNLRTDFKTWRSLGFLKELRAIFFPGIL